MKSRTGLFVVVCAAILLATVSAGAAPLSDDCSAEGLVRVLQDGPSCTVTVECPADAIGGCVFQASGTFESLATVATAQGKLSVRGDDEADFFCSAPAAIVATGEDASCTVGPVFAFYGPGTLFEVTCTFVGQTVSVLARVICSAGFDPI